LKIQFHTSDSDKVYHGMLPNGVKIHIRTEGEQEVSESTGEFLINSRPDLFTLVGNKPKRPKRIAKKKSGV
jgi:hypothetical protein